MDTQHTDPSLATQYVTFRVGELLFGLDVGQVQEVLRAQPMTPVPLAPKAIRGLVNLRGQIITAIDLRSMIGMDDTDSPEPAMNVVVHAEGERISLLVDSIGDVLEMDPVDYEDTPDTIASNIGGIVQGVFKLEQDLLLVINAQSCLQIPA